jgi:hypothetical protein
VKEYDDDDDDDEELYFLKKKLLLPAITNIYIPASSVKL